MDGYEVAVRLRAGGSRARLVALTGYGQAEDRARSRASGFAAHLTKPIDFDTVVQAIERFGPRPPTDGDGAGLPGGAGLA